jgi:hypothetical protein
MANRWTNLKNSAKTLSRFVLKLTVCRNRENEKNDENLSIKEEMPEERLIDRLVKMKSHGQIERPGVHFD